MGGTNILRALKVAFNLKTGSRFKRIFLLTDGEVDNVRTVPCFQVKLLMLLGDHTSLVYQLVLLNGPMKKFISMSYSEMRQFSLIESCQLINLKPYN